MGKEDIKRVREFARKISKHLDVKKVILFGSRARGDSLKHSDFDVIVISKDFEKIPFSRRAIILYDDWKHDISLEVLCYTPEEFKEKKGQISIIKEVIKEGIEIIG